MNSKFMPVFTFLVLPKPPPATPLTKFFSRNGIQRSVEEQQKEAIGILSAALKRSSKKLRRQLGVCKI